jgi:hypothetical protein
VTYLKLLKQAGVDDPQLQQQALDYILQPTLVVNYVIKTCPKGS